jgi:hypothetical protein
MLTRPFWSRDLQGRAYSPLRTKIKQWVRRTLQERMMKGFACTWCFFFRWSSIQAHRSWCGVQTSLLSSAEGAANINPSLFSIDFSRYPQNVEGHDSNRGNILNTWGRGSSLCASSAERVDQSPVSHLTASSTATPSHGASTTNTDHWRRCSSHCNFMRWYCSQYSS